MHFVLRHTMSQCLQSENLVSETTGNRFFLSNKLYTELHFAPGVVSLCFGSRPKRSANPQSVFGAHTGVFVKDLSSSYVAERARGAPRLYVASRYLTV